MIKVLQIPIKLPVVATNSTIILDDPLTIVDPGNKHENTVKMFEEELSIHGKSVKDVKRILLTHGHIDHFGCAEWIKRISGAEIFIHENDYQKASRTHREDDIYTEFYKNTLLEHGSPEKGLRGVDNFMKYIETMYEPLKDVTFTGANVEFDNSNWEVIETPGHTSGCVVYYNEENEILISGDTLIKEISPNPVIEFNSEGKRFNSQAIFRETIDKLKTYKFKRIIPGHGEEIFNFDLLFSKYQKGWELRENKLTEIFKETPCLTAYEMMEKVFGELEEFQIFLGMSEMIGMFDLLESRNIIEYHNENGIVKACYKK